MSELAIPELRLSVNIDHVATLRQARGTPYPDPLEAAEIAERAGAAGITVHLRGDRRHVQDFDVEHLSDGVEGKLNLEIATAEEMLELAERLRPQQVTLVPERPGEVTTEGGLDLLATEAEVRRAAERLASAGIEVSLFVDPSLAQIEAADALGAEGTVTGLEINTDAYAQASLAGLLHDLAARDHGDGDDTTPLDDPLTREIDALHTAARAIQNAGFKVYAGHGLTTKNVGAVAAILAIEELNIGHFLVSRAAMIGMAGAVGEMLGAMRRARG